MVAHRFKLLVEVTELAVSVEDLMGLAVGRYNLNLVHLQKAMSVTREMIRSL